MQCTLRNRAADKGMRVGVKTEINGYKPKRFLQWFMRWFDGYLNHIILQLKAFVGFYHRIYNSSSLVIHLRATELWF